MNYIHLLSSPVTEALGWTLLHAIWQGFMLVLPVAVVLQLLRHRSSALRYHVGTLTLLAQVLLSAVTFAWYYTPQTQAVPVHTAAAFQTLPVRWQTVAQTVPWHQQMQFFLQSHLSQFVLIYLLGVGLFGLRLLGGWLYLQQLTRTATRPVSALANQLTDRLQTTLALRKAVLIRESARIGVPMVVGVLKPVLLLPVSLATQLTARELEAVLAHELAHIKRQDYAVNLLQSVVEVLYFFHPALWWLSARVREEREHCCDDLAVQACGGNGRILAQALAHVEELRLLQSTATPALAMAFAGKRQHLLQRVRRVLGVPTRPFVSNGSLAGLTLATVLLMSVSVYAVQQQGKPKTTQPRPPATRTHTIDGNSKYGMVDTKTISYIIWKGQKLPAARIERLQRKLDQVMAGQLNLDAVKQPDRDILLTIIEKNSAFDNGMSALTNGLAHIDYSNLVASALTNVTVSPNGPVEDLTKADHSNLINDTFSSLPALLSLPDSLDKLSQQQFGNDTIPAELQNKFLELKLKYDQLHNQLTKQEKAMETYIALMREPGKQWRHLELEQWKLQKELAYMQKQASRADFRAINDALLAEIATAERNLSEARKRMNELSQKDLRPYSDSLSRVFKRLERLRDSIRTNEGELINLAPAAPAPPGTPPVAPLVNAPAPPPLPPAKAIKPVRGRVKPAAVPKPPKPAKAPKADWPEKPELPEEPEQPN